MRGAVLASALIASAPAAAQTCSCTSPSVADLIEDRRDLIVVTARIRAILPGAQPAGAVLTLEILETLKGEAPRLVDLTGTTEREAPCGVDFRAGELRTLALVKTPDGRWTTDRCLVAQP